MITCLLTGGNDRDVKGYASKIREYFPDSGVNVASCFFSSPEDTWMERHNTWDKWFSAHGLNVATHDVVKFDDFEEKINNADVIYFHGGNTKLLIKCLKAYDLAKLLEGKLVIGSSAGAAMLAKTYWSATYRQPGKGLGIVPANVMVHYGAQNFTNIERSMDDWEQDKQKFMDYAKTKDILCLPEGYIEKIERET